MAPDSFGSCLGCCLEHTGHAITALTESLYFKGSPASLAICHPPGHFSVPSSYAPKGQLLGLISGLGHQLPDCQRMSVPYEPGCGRQ